MTAYVLVKEYYMFAIEFVRDRMCDAYLRVRDSLCARDRICVCNTLHVRDKICVGDSVCDGMCVCVCVSLVCVCVCVCQPRALASCLRVRYSTCVRDIISQVRDRMCS